MRHDAAFTRLDVALRAYAGVTASNPSDWIGSLEPSYRLALLDALMRDLKEIGFTGQAPATPVPVNGPSAFNPPRAGSTS